MSTFFFYPVLKALSNGQVIRKSIALALRVLAVLSVLFGAYLLIEILKTAFQLPNEGTIGGILFALIFLTTVLSIGQIFWFRANSVLDLGDSPFTVIPIVSLLLRTAGEVYAALGVAVGVGGCLFIWFAKNNPFWLLRGLTGILPSASPEATFMGGISFLVYLAVISLLVLIVFYFLAESSVVLVDVALHVRLPAGLRGPANSGPEEIVRCPTCAIELESRARFCPKCGSQVPTAIGAAR
jgi:hypothetical protein